LAFGLVVFSAFLRVSASLRLLLIFALETT